MPWRPRGQRHDGNSSRRPGQTRPRRARPSAPNQSASNATPQSLPEASPAGLRTPHLGLQSIQNQCFRRSPNVYPTFTRTSLHNFAEKRNRRPNHNLALIQRLADLCLALSARRPAARGQLPSEGLARLDRAGLAPACQTGRPRRYTAKFTASLSSRAPNSASWVAKHSKSML